MYKRASSTNLQINLSKLKARRPTTYLSFIPVLLLVQFNTVYAQSNPVSPKVPSEPENLLIVGSRRVLRSLLESTTPVDSLKGSELTQQASTDIDDLLRNLVPSYSVNAQPISDAASLIRPANLRGLPPDSTVVLINGKRRHRGAVITFLAGGLSDGAQGVDLAPIPALALKRVDILRDGAAAQYGSDAIAGVMNFSLRDNADGIESWTRIGSYLTEDIDEYAWSSAINIGLPFTNSGFVNITAEYGHSQPTNRSVQRGDAARLNELEELQGQIPNPAHIWGSPQISHDLKTFVNLGVNISDNTQLYAFGNFARRTVQGGLYYRNPRTRRGVYAGDERTLDINGQQQTDRVIRVGDLSSDSSGNCPEFLQYDDDTGQIDPDDLQQLQNDPNCFVWNEVLPAGFRPKLEGIMTDLSLAGGVRGHLSNGLTWDISAIVGANEADFMLRDTINASLGPSSPTSLDPGAYREVDQTYNIDISYPMDISFLASNLTLSSGFEYRKETFVLSAGEPLSYTPGPLAEQGFSVGSNGFSGFTPSIAGTFTRDNIGVYFEAAANIIDPWTVLLAARVEDFDSFGTQGTVKASSRFAIVQPERVLGTLSHLAIRASIGTGYRAPSAGQINVSNISTAASPSGGLEEQGTIPPTNPIAIAKGARPLQPETSLNITGGFILQLGKFFEITSDYYYIKVRDRISQSAAQSLTEDQRQALEDSGVAGARGLATFRFFTNAFDTTTQGVEVVASSRFSLADAGALSLNMAYTWNETTVDDYIEGVITSHRIRQIEDPLPRHRGVVTANYLLEALRITNRATYFGTFKSFDRNVDDNVVFSDEVIFDLELAYSFSNEFTFVAGAQNIFDERPDENPIFRQLDTGDRYPRNAPMGFNGAFYYTRAQLTF